MPRRAAQATRRATTCLLAGFLAGAGCATTSGPTLTPPDAAAVHAATIARTSFEAERPLVDDADLTARLTAMGQRVLANTPLAGAGANRGMSLADGWRFGVLDETARAAFLFADRTLLVSRGALAALPGEPALEELFRGAAAAFGGGGFRAPNAGGLFAQPLQIELPIEFPVAWTPEQPAPDSDRPPDGRDRDAWLDLLDGLPFGEPVRFGAALGPELLLPQGDLRLTLPAGLAFAADERGVFRAVRSRDSTRPPLSGLMVRELPLPPDPDAREIREGDTGSAASARRLVRGLAARFTALAASRGGEPSFLEVFRVRGFTGVRGRIHGADDALTLAALLRAPETLVEVHIECADQPLRECEARLLEVLGSAERLWDLPIPGPLRIRAVHPEAFHPGELSGGAPSSGGAASARSVVRRLVASAGADGTLKAVEFLNRSWLDEPLGPDDRVLLLVRDGGQRPVDADEPDSLRDRPPPRRPAR